MYRPVDLLALISYPDPNGTNLKPKIPSFRAKRSEDPETRMLEVPDILDSRLRGNADIPSLSSL